MLRVDSLALWKIIPKNGGENFSSGFLHSVFFGVGGVSRYAAIPLIVTLLPGHKDITGFRPWSPIATGNHLDRAEKIPKVAQTTGTVDVFDPRSGILGPTSRRASACPNLHERRTHLPTLQIGSSALHTVLYRYENMSAVLLPAMCRLL